MQKDEQTVQDPTDLLRFSSSSWPSEATIPRTSLVNVRWDAWVQWRVFSWHKTPAADFSCWRICPVVSSSFWWLEWSSLSTFAEWYFPRLTGWKLIRSRQIKKSKCIIKTRKSPKVLSWCQVTINNCHLKSKNLYTTSLEHNYLNLVTKFTT